MSRRAANHERQALQRAVQRASQRRARASEPSLWQSLSMAGSLGWLVVVPTLLGAVAGRWLDRLLATGIQFTAALIFVGAAVGGWLIWRHIRRGHDE